MSQRSALAVVWFLWNLRHNAEVPVKFQSNLIIFTPSLNIKTSPADAMASHVVRPSAHITLTLWNRQVLVLFMMTFFKIHHFHVEKLYKLEINLKLQGPNYSGSTYYVSSKQFCIRSVNSSPPSAAYMHQENLVSIGSDNGLAPIQHQAII